MVPARRNRQDLIRNYYSNYTECTSIAIRRPLCDNHREIRYLESLLLFLTQDCKQIFQTLIRCDYLLETHQIKRIKQ